MDIKIYLSNLSRYVEGRENGRWLSLPMAEDKLRQVFAEIVGNGNEGIILDYNAPFSIGEYESVFDLNERMENLADVDETTCKLLCEYCDTLEEAMEILENENYSIIDVDRVSSGWNVPANSDELFGMVLNEEGYNNLFSTPIPEEMIDYMDFAQIYCCLSVNDRWQDISIDGNTYLVTVWRR